MFWAVVRSFIDTQKIYLSGVNKPQMNRVTPMLLCISKPIVQAILLFGSHSFSDSILSTDPELMVEHSSQVAVCFNDNIFSSIQLTLSFFSTGELFLSVIGCQLSFLLSTVGLTNVMGSFLSLNRNQNITSLIFFKVPHEDVTLTLRKILCNQACNVCQSANFHLR